MFLNKSLQYTFRIGSDNQHRIHWQDSRWHYEFLAGGVLFDEQFYPSDQELQDGLAAHGLQLEQFSVDTEFSGAAYSETIQKKMKKLLEEGMVPCAKHGLMSKNPDGTCEACSNTDFPDDFKGQEG